MNIDDIEKNLGSFPVELTKGVAHILLMQTQILATVGVLTSRLLEIEGKLNYYDDDKIDYELSQINKEIEHAKNVIRAQVMPLVAPDLSDRLRHRPGDDAKQI